MRLLIITQKVNKDDPILGFFHRWIEEFSKHFEKVLVICLEEGVHVLPNNVSVLSLGKEKGFGRLRILTNFYKTIAKNRKEYDAVFVHMNQIYLFLGSLLWEAWRKRIFFWYTHKSTPLLLRLVKNIPYLIFTASKESFRLSGDNVVVTGHGIDVEIFKDKKTRIEDEVLKIITTGRVSPTKNIALMIDVMNELAKNGESFSFKVIGDKTENLGYFKILEDKIKRYELEDRIEFVGSCNQEGVVEYCNWADILLNFSNTGSLDKSVLEAMACGVKVLTTNEAFQGFPLEYAKSNETINLATLLVDLKSKKVDGVREYIVNNHNLLNLVEKISQNIKKYE